MFSAFIWIIIYTQVVTNTLNKVEYIWDTQYVKVF